MHTDRCNFRAPSFEADNAIVTISRITEQETYQRDSSIRRISKRDNNTDKQWEANLYAPSETSPEAHRELNPNDGQYNQYDGNYRRDTITWPSKPQDSNIHYDQGAKISRTEATQLMMNKLRLTNNIIANMGHHCWTCGAGRAELGGEYHKSSKCQLLLLSSLKAIPTLRVISASKVNS